jgi:DNA-binding response OmpR family regulator
VAHIEMNPVAPDVLLLASEWPERALLRAQLIEEGYEVVAVEAWPLPKLYRVPGMEPRLLLVDLQGLSRPRETLAELWQVGGPTRVLVVTALGTVTADEARALGFDTIQRPATIGQIVTAVAALLGRASPR